MPWFKVDDGLSSKLETTRIPRAHRAAAIGLWTLAGSWSARELTDGHIPLHMVEELSGTLEDAERLVVAGFWETVHDGFQFVVWDGEQPMRAKVLEAREKNAAKVASWRARNSVTPPVTNQGTNSDVTLPPTRPVPSHPIPPSDEEKNTSSPAAIELEDHFDRAWSHWPKKEAKKRALLKFKAAAKRRDAETLVADIIRFGDAYAATRERKFVPGLAKWLEGEQWTDDLPAPKTPTDAEWQQFVGEDIRDGFLFRQGKPVIGGPNGMNRDQYDAWVAAERAKGPRRHQFGQAPPLGPDASFAEILERGRRLSTPTRGEENLAYLQQVIDEEASEGAGCDHRWLEDGTCNFCTARRGDTTSAIGAA